jgi:hypothetical protein
MPDPPPPSGDGSSTAQDEIVAAARSILADVQANGYPGFSGLVADGTGPTLDLYWVAGQALPPDVAALVADPGQPITVTRMDAVYGKSFLDSRADALMNAPDFSGQICGLMHTIIVPEEGYGLNVQAQPYQGVDQAVFPVQAAAVLSQYAGVPVQVTVAPAPTETGRQNDIAPWWAGGRTTSNGGCSAGFGVVRRIGATSTPYLLSAAHCANPGAQVSNGVAAPGNTVIGTVRDFLPGFDSELVQVDPAMGVRPAVFKGAWDAGDFISPVNTTGVNVKGLLMFVCTSGASTGQNCLLNINNTDVRILNVDLSITLLRLQWTTNLVTAKPLFFRAAFLGVAVGKGDSGGPVIQYTAGGGARAVGTMVAGSGVVPCGDAAPKVICFSQVYYADINKLLDTYGVDLVQ